jgi:hypothetical protein
VIHIEKGATLAAAGFLLRSLFCYMPRVHDDLTAVLVPKTNAQSSLGGGGASY